MSAGLLSGGLTSSPTLAAAQDAVQAGSVAITKGWTQDQVIDNIAMGYALTYIFGLVGLIFGAITGAMTSGAALSVVIKEAKSSVPALGYTGTYAFANVILVIAGSLIMMF